MKAWSDVPVFGVHLPGVALVTRPSAYGVVVGAGSQVAVVFTPQGAFLPGGGIESGESPEDAICREAAEECGLVIRLDAWTRRAIQLVYAERESAYFEKRTTFVRGAVVRAGIGTVEVAHELRWLDASAAAELLTPESHRWAVGEWSHGTAD